MMMRRRELRIGEVYKSSLIPSPPIILYLPRGTAGPTSLYPPQPKPKISLPSLLFFSSVYLFVNFFCILERHSHTCCLSIPLNCILFLQPSFDSLLLDIIKVLQLFLCCMFDKTNRLYISLIIRKRRRVEEEGGIMGDSSASYIHMVQHLIEKCLIFHMTQEECMEALSKHANIKPVITSTVWKELEKENREFFEEYARNRGDRMSEAETTQKIQKIISESSTNRHSDDDEEDDD